jgi:hypothetical protein
MLKHTAVLASSVMGLASLFAQAGAIATPQATLANMQVTGTVPVRIELNNNQAKVVQLMQVQLSQAAAKQLGQNIAMVMQQPHQMMASNSNMPSKANATMNGLPVLDQGRWGSCATFASTAAVDATLGLSGDNTVSQLCNLELGKTLNELQGADGGWQGSFGYLVLGQVEKYGYLPMSYQKSQGCGGLKAYPVGGGSNGQAMSKAEFAQGAVHAFSKANWKDIAHYNGSFKPIDPQEGQQYLDKVKSAIVKGHRVVFGTLLDQWVGQAGAIGKYEGATNDAWVLTDQIKRDIEQGWPAGHEMVIYGYDDNACASFNGTKQCGLLRLRNSWSAGAGAKGDYFMSYDYFKTMAIESYELGQNL